MEIAVFCDVPNALFAHPSAPCSSVVPFHVCLGFFGWFFFLVITYTNMENRKLVALST